MGISLVSSTAQISLQDNTQDSGTSDLGDLVNSDHWYDVDWEPEEPERYDSGLCYPICIGDVLIDTYRIEHKLGHGDFSTVWLARDIKEERDVAFKIMAAGNEGDNEYSMQNKIISAVQGTSNLVTYLTAFSLPGRNRNYQVLVFPVRGPNFHAVMLNQISMANRMSAARQLLKALECLHNANIVHHSELTPTCFFLICLGSVHAKYSTDLNGKCVMWGVTYPLDNLNTKTNKYKYIGRPKKMALPSNSWRRGELVTPFKVPKRLITDAVYLGGFKMATEAGTEVKDKVPSPVNINYYAPERFHDVNPSFTSDMWSYMCLFSELYLGGVPWGGHSNVSMITKMVGILGPLPKQYGRAVTITSVPQTTRDHMTHGTLRGPFLCHPYRTLESIIKQQRPEVSEVERNHILSIMSKVFCYSPDDRSTATQLLQDPSFQAVMEIYCR
ncbi:Protein kinase-like domain containing protein [Elaphomyces granulatus]